MEKVPFWPRYLINISLDYPFKPVDIFLFNISHKQIFVMIENFWFLLDECKGPTLLLILFAQAFETVNSVVSSSGAGPLLLLTWLTKHQVKTYLNI